MSTNDGGPAFPVPMLPGESWDSEKYGNPNGMSMRDWFAGMALQGLLASGHFTIPACEADDQSWMTTHPDPYDDETGEEIHPGRFQYDFPEAAWKCADAMIKARKEDAQ